ncbi:MAG: MlaD family protein [Flavobacteriales bacterium]
MSKNLKAGIIAVASIGAFVLLINFLKGKNVFNRGTVLYAVYEDVHGLQETKPVTINGMKVGHIDNIDFTDDDSGKLLVQMTINTDFKFDKNTKAIIYEPGLMSGAEVKLEMSRKDKPVKDGDYIIGEVESGMLSILAKEATPLKQKLENVLASIDSTLVMVRGLVTPENKKSIANLVRNLDQTILSFNQMAKSVRTTVSKFDNTAQSFNGLALEAKGLISENRTKLASTLTNLDSTMHNFNHVAEDLNHADLDQTIAKLDQSLNNLNNIMSGIQKGEGSLGKLVKDEAVYNNLNHATKELELLLRDMKENPKRYVHFSIFGKKNKPYVNQEIKNDSKE